MSRTARSPSPAPGTTAGRRPWGRGAAGWVAVACLAVVALPAQRGPAAVSDTSSSVGVVDARPPWLPLDAAQPTPGPPEPVPPDPDPPAPVPSSPSAKPSPDAATGGVPIGVPPAPSGAGMPAPGAGYAWPLLPAPAVITPFRAPAHAYGPGHRGVDLAGTTGQPVLAARAGTVVFAGRVAGRPVVSVQHDDGLRTTYEPVTPAVGTGAVVSAGAALGVLEPGHPGCPAAACLHWGVRRDRTDYLDPLVLLRPPRVRLLPVPDPWPVP